jgi:hypothetical protein
MEITHDVILDLLPLYLADEVSTDTRALIEHYLATDPQLAQLAEQAAAANLYQDVPIPINTEAEMQTFKKVKRLMFQHNLFLGLAIAFTFLFAMSIPFLWDDHPSATPVFFIIGGIFWLAFFKVNRQLSE